MAVDYRRAVAALAAERPEWIPVLEAAIAVSDRLEPLGGEFAGAWVIEEIERRSGHRTWLPNLRVLVSHGLVEKAGETTRGGRRAYYRFRDRHAIQEALSALTPRQRETDVERPVDRRLRLIAAGDSGEAGSDLARRSSDLPYEPESWR